MTLLLLPNLLSEENLHALYLPPILGECMGQLKGIIAESEKEARRYLKQFIPHFREIPIQLLNEHTKQHEIELLLKPLLNQQTWGLISDAGVPCIADPGHQLVAKAYELGIQVEAFAGPSSILLALMLSGLCAQKFAFHGYLSREEQELRTEIKKLEKEKITHLFIEAPYRSQKMLDLLLLTLNDKTKLCIASDLTGQNQFVGTHTVEKWKQIAKPQINKKPTVFLFAVGSPFK
ncbi:MAG TPA: SAM-dependent methyltransferase [Rhabdochlamydiaceae bacterium]|nr:SAM-dependent methyltransferase [Rhabdochlamydiaceae bacterium]